MPLPLLPLLMLGARAAPVPDEALPGVSATANPFEIADTEYRWGLREAQIDFDQYTPRWIQSYEAIGLLSRERDAIDAHIMDLEKALIELSSRRSLSAARVLELQATIDRLEQDLYVATSSVDIVRAAVVTQQQKLDEAVARADNAAKVMSAALLHEGRAARPAAAKLERWWSTRRGMRWDEVLSSGVTSLDAAAHDQARRDFETLAGALGAGVQQSLVELAFLADQEDQVRFELVQMRNAARIDEAGIRNLESGLADQRELLAAEQAALSAAELDLAATRTDLEHARAARPASGPGDDAWRRLQNQLAALDDRLARLTAQVETYGEPMDGDAWCGLFVRAGLVRVMSPRPGAYAEGVSLLRHAAVAHTGPCRAVMQSYLYVPVFQAAWAEALLLAASSSPGSAVVGLSDGRWHIDGTLLVGAGSTVLRLMPGVHRFEYEENGGFAWQVENIAPGEHVMLAASPHGVAVTPTTAGSTGEIDLLSNAPGAFESYLPPPAPAPVSPDPRRARFTASARLMRVAWLDDAGTSDLAGASAEIAWRANTGPRLAVDLGFAQDVALGDQTWQYTEAFSFPGLLRERATLGLRRPDGRLRPGASLSLGFIPPGQALIVEAGPELEFNLSEDISAAVGLQVGSSIWQLQPESIEPSVSFGVVRWF